MKDDFQQRLQSLSDADLLNMIDKNSGDYTTEAISAVNEEVRRRGGRDKLNVNIEAERKKIRRERELPQREAERKTADMKDEFRQRLESLSDEDLLKMIDKNYLDYTPKAIMVAKEEVRRRGGRYKLNASIEAERKKFQQEEELARQEAERKRAERKRREAEEDERDGRDAEHELNSFGIFSGTRTLKDETISEVWHTLIPDGAGHVDKVIANIKNNLEQVNFPVKCRWGVVEVKTRAWVSRVRRDFLIVELDDFRDYHNYISVRDYGTYLDCLHVLTVEPNFVKKFLSRKLFGNEEALSQPKNILKYQDLTTWNTIVQDCVSHGIDMFIKELGQDSSRIITEKKQLLEIW